LVTETPRLRETAENHGIFTAEAAENAENCATAL
jgi:hypothetical protein